MSADARGVGVRGQDSRMPRHIESMRDEVERHAKASFFMLHNLAADRCL